MGKRSRTKGHSFEREMARYFSKRLGLSVRRGLQYRDGAECPDIVGVPGFWIECKRMKRVPLSKSMRQAIDDAGEGEIPMVVARSDRTIPIVVVHPEDLDELGHCRERDVSIPAGNLLNERAILKIKEGRPVVVADDFPYDIVDLEYISGLMARRVHAWSS